MKSTKPIENVVTDIIKQFFSDSNIDIPHNFSVEMRLSDLALDSMQLIEIVFKIENYYAIALDEEQLAELRTIRDIVLVVESAQYVSDQA